MALTTDHPEYQAAAGGIRSPKPATLFKGEVVMRFVASTHPTTGAAIPPAQWREGAWWIREKDFYAIVDKAKDGTLPVGFAFRSALAVMPSYSPMDRCIKAIAQANVDCFAGPAKPQYREMLENGMYITMPGWPEIEQLYIPEMRRNRKTGALGANVGHLMVVDTMVVPQPLQLKPAK
jgi:hypothetical protein